MRYLFILLLMASCRGVDYYHSDAYKIKQRQEQAMQMFHQTRAVRKQCSTRRDRPRKPRRKNAYYD